jgi:hypothetical protein
MQIESYNTKRSSKYWQPEWIEANFLMVTILRGATFRETYLYNSMEGQS